MYAWMKKEVLFGKLLLCFLLFLIWCCLMPTAAMGANGEAAAEDYVTTIVVLPSDPPSKVEWCFKLEIQECAMLVGGYYAVISGNEFLVYPQPYDILTLIDMLQGLFYLDELSWLFETEISLISGPPLLVTIDEFEQSVEAGTTLTIGLGVISQQPTQGDVVDDVGPPEDSTPDPFTGQEPPSADEQPTDPIPPGNEPFETPTPEPASRAETG